MSDLAQQIRERLDGFAPPVGEPPSQFVEILDPGDQTPEEIERWQQQWDELFGTPDKQSIHVLATAPRFYPGFEQMRDALLAVLDDHATTSFGWCRRCSTLREEGWPARQGWKGGDCPTVREIAKGLGIEVDRG